MNFLKISLFLLNFMNRVTFCNMFSDRIPKGFIKWIWPELSIVKSRILDF